MNFMTETYGFENSPKLLIAIDHIFLLGLGKHIELLDPRYLFGLKSHPSKDTGQFLPRCVGPELIDKDISPI